MIRAIALGVLVGGLALTLYGVNASRAFGSEVTRFFTGNPSDHSMWLMGGGVAMITLAVALLLGGRRRSGA